MTYCGFRPPLQNSNKALYSSVLLFQEHQVLYLDFHSLLLLSPTLYYLFYKLLLSFCLQTLTYFHKCYAVSIKLMNPLQKTS